MVSWRGNAEPLPIAPLRHRGPDGSGSWLSSDGRCWLGHTRLAIQDPSCAGAQPITSHCGRFTLVFNGEIVNLRQVRQGLRFQAWRGSSDSETLVEGLAQRGLAIVLELRGMFAFAAYDCQKEQLLLGRDRLGIKPLYLSWQPDSLLFASERAALPDGQRLDGQTITQVLAFGHDRTPAHFPGPPGRGAVSLPAGMVARINHSRPHDPVRYWPPQPRPDWTPLPIRSRRWAQTFLRQQLEEAVGQHLVADVPVACLLSSGLKSGVLAALACRQHPGEVATVTVSLPGAAPIELIQAARFADHCGSRHQELVIEEHQALSWLEQGLVSLDVPSAGGLSTYLISRAVAAQGIKVGLSGLGADQLFGGCASHRLMRWLLLLRWLPPWLRERLLQGLSGRLAPKLAALPHWDRWHLALALHRRAGDGDLAAAGAEPLQWHESAPQRITQGWGQISWAELFGSAEPQLLRDADAASMGCGLELRLPFLDHRLVEIALRMPQRFQRPGNALLRQACSDLFPPGYLDVPQRGSPLPMARWMRGPLAELCRSRLAELQESGCLDGRWIQSQWRAFEAEQLSWSLPWSLVVLGEFASRVSRPVLRGD